MEGVSYTGVYGKRSPSQGNNNYKVLGPQGKNRLSLTTKWKETREAGMGFAGKRGSTREMEVGSQGACRPL